MTYERTIEETVRDTVRETVKETVKETLGRTYDCIFHNNQNTLFCVCYGSLEVSHLFISLPGSFSTFSAVSTSNNNTLTNRITYQLQFVNSLHCNADIYLIN